MGDVAGFLGGLIGVSLDPLGMGLAVVAGFAFTRAWWPVAVCCLLAAGVASLVVVSLNGDDPYLAARVVACLLAGSGVFFVRKLNRARRDARSQAAGQ